MDKLFISPLTVIVISGILIDVMETMYHNQNALMAGVETRLFVVSITAPATFFKRTVKYESLPANHYKGRRTNHGQEMVRRCSLARRQALPVALV